jgi:hypothetical protein
MNFFVRHFTRPRALLVYLLPLAALGLLAWLDPDEGSPTTLTWLALTCRAFLLLGAAHLVRRLWHDYPEADMQRLFGEARKSPTGAGLALVALAIIISAILGLFASQARAQDLRTHIVPHAYQYLPALGAEQRRWWPDHPEPAHLAALIEHESGCFALKRKCWNPRSQLRSAREEGAGFGQITRTWREDGSQRFDALAEMLQAHPELAGWSWENVYERPDLQLRAVVLKVRGDYQAFRMIPDPIERLRFADVAYNRGRGGVQAERQACALKAGCDPKRWTGHVETTCTASRRPLYGGRSACDISRHHPKDVFARIPKYQGLW